MPTPRITSFNLGVQHEVLAGTILHVNYVGTFGDHLTRTVNINQLRAGTQLNPPASATNINALRPYLGYGNMTITENEDESRYHSLQLSLTRRLLAGLEFGANYTFSRTTDTTGGTPQDVYNISADARLSSVHRAHTFNGHFIWRLPFFHDAGSLVVRNVLGGWDISGVVVAQSGAPFTVTAPVDAARIGVNTTRATLIGDPELPANERTPQRWFNTGAFLNPALMTPGEFGNSPRNVLTGPSFNRVDFGLMKSLKLTGRTNLQLRADAFNIFNTVSFTGLNTTVRFDAAGNPAGGYGQVTSAAPGRVMEFGVRLTF
jgi:hypothetical protein